MVQQSDRLSAETLAGELKIRILVGSFKVAEMDLKLRGPGEIWGLRQSGYPVFKLINPLIDKDIVDTSWRVSHELLREDPKLEKIENRVVSKYFQGYCKTRMELADIG